MISTAYRCYRYSGIEWLGDIPANWAVKRLKFVSQIASSGVWGEDPIPDVENCRVATTANIDMQGNINTEGMTIRALSQRELEIGQCQPGDLIVVKSSGSATNVVSGKAGLVKEEHLPICFSNFTLRVRPTPALLDPRFLWRFLNSEVVKAQVRLMVATTTYPNLQVGEYASFYLPVPDYEDQRAIADYLDRETARLDGLASAKERVLGLLAEQRRALITHAVTRGLDSHAPLRDSGIPWLGKIPAHWETPPVYSRFEVQLGKMLDEKKIKGTHLAPYLRNVDVQWGTINTTDLPEMDFDDDDRVKYSLRAGDILVCEGGEVGRCAIWDGEYDECYYQKALHRLRVVHGKDEARFFVLVMRTLVEAGVFSSQASASTIQHLPAEKLRVVRYPAPPLSEQRAIVAHIATETAKLDALCSATERTIALLKERRTALIAAAVTGRLHIPEAT